MTTIGKYQLHHLLGSGATADVYQAIDTDLNRFVALKLLKPALIPDGTAFARFAQEARAAASLFHPNIATVLDMGDKDGRFFIALRYIDGPSVDLRLKAVKPLPFNDVVRLAQQIGDALDYAHKKGFLHRDVKPANILCDSDGSYILTDFGLTKAIMTTGLTTHTGVVLGTPAYISPESWLNQAITPASDQYALACVLFETLTGQVLFTGDTPPAIMAGHMLVGPQFPVSWPEGVPEGIGTVLQRALSKDPEQRYASCNALALALRDSSQSRPTTISTPVLEPDLEDKQTTDEVHSAKSPEIEQQEALPTPENKREKPPEPTSKPISSNSQRQAETKTQKATSPWVWAVGFVVLVGILLFIFRLGFRAQQTQVSNMGIVKSIETIPVTLPTSTQRVIAATRTPTASPSPTPALTETGPAQPIPTLPAIQILWTNDCDPRSDPEYCREVSDPSLLEAFYAVVESVNGTLTYQQINAVPDLSAYDVIIANFCANGMNLEGSISKLQDYVRNGGSVIAMGDNFCLWDVSTAELASRFSQAFGISFTSDDTSDTVTFTPAVNHQLTENVNTIFMRRHAFIETTGQFTSALFQVDGKTAVGLYDGEGTIVAIPFVGLHWGEGTPGTEPLDNFIFWKNMFIWLSQQHWDKR